MSVTVHRCICMLQRTGVFLQPMGTTQIPIPIINLSAFVRHYASVCLCETTHRCICTTYGHRINTNTNYKSQCVCEILRTDAFMWEYAPMHLYNLWASHKYQYELEQLVCLSDTAHRCASIRLRIGALIRPIGTAQITIPIRMAPCVVSPTLCPVRF